MSEPALWEYKFILLNTAQVEATLNEKGKEGWEIFTFTPLATSEWAALLRRPVPK